MQFTSPQQQDAEFRRMFRKANAQLLDIYPHHCTRGQSVHSAKVVRGLPPDLEAGSSGATTAPYQRAVGVLDRCRRA